MQVDPNRSLQYPIGPDGRSGDQPRGVRVVGNLVREIGIWQKQSSGWFQAVTAQTEIRGNVMFNGPRAAINFNDGFGGGDSVAENLLLNMVRESKDHGCVPLVLGGSALKRTRRVGAHVHAACGAGHRSFHFISRSRAACGAGAQAFQLMGPRSVHHDCAQRDGKHCACDPDHRPQLRPGQL